MRLTRSTRHDIVIGSVMVVLGMLVGSARAELPVPIPNDPSANEATCRQEIAKQRLSPQDQGDLYRCKLDFARLEHDYPLTHDQLNRITPADLMARETTQERIDQIYARLTAGPIPDGRYEIRLFRLTPGGPQGSVPFEDYASLAGVKGKGAAILLKRSRLIRDIVPVIWRGKVFEKDNHIVRTELFGPTLLAAKITQRLKTSIVEPMERAMDDLVASIHRQFPQRADSQKVAAELDADFKETFPEVHEVEKELEAKRPPLFFPAKVYCGQSLLDGRRESIIIDYAFSQNIPGYRPKIDKLTGPTRLQIRDEIRMVRPGFYLGRVYMGRIFVFNFVLYHADLLNKPPAESAWDQEDCDIGLQRQMVHR